MRKLKATENLALKITAVFVFFFAVIGLGLGLVGIVAGEEMGVYDGDGGWFGTRTCTDALQSHGWRVVHRYVTEGASFGFSIETGADDYSPRQTNLRFAIRDGLGNTLCTNGVHEVPAYAVTWHYAIDGMNVMRIDNPAFDTGGVVIVTEEGKVESKGGVGIVTVELSLPAVLKKGDDFYRLQHLYDLLEGLQKLLPILAFLSAMTLVISFLFLCCAAGHHEGREGITFNPQDRVPFDLYLLLAFWAACLPCLGAVFVQQNMQSLDNLWFLVVIYALLGGVLALVLLAVLLTTVTRFKAGKWWRNTLVWMVCALCFRMIRACFRTLAAAFRAFRMEWRVLLGTAVFFALLSILLFESPWEPLCLMLAVGLMLAALTVCCLFAARLRRILEAGHAMAEGELDHKVDTDRLYGELKRHGEDLNSIADGLNIAVEQRMKSERMKTELITNVSHDIKTPLTSIINYVDLLKKEPLEGKAREYADTLERHANRLKKLTEDLVEASKAATGNIRAELIPMNLCELVNQAVGEYSERLQKSRIEPVVALPDSPRYILADGRLIWRVIENLLSNAAKYAQPGTRLYIALLEKHGRITLEIKNISRDRLNIHADELMERFVRADSSRHTEGSGLGLNIAKSLAELQGGKMAIEIDGDLFKVTLTFDRLDDQLDFLDEGM